jgi:hypothetical protein
MEVAGLALGIAGLAGLFTSCIGTFQLIQHGRSFGKDFKILETKFSNQELRLRTWGRACGLVDSEVENYDPILDEPELHQQLQATLECIKHLLCDGFKLRKQYGLKPCKTRRRTGSLDLSRTRSSTTTSFAPSTTTFHRLFRNHKPGKSSSICSATSWVIEDKDKFSELVMHLREFIDDLEALTRKTTTAIVERQLVFIGFEVESICDVETLEDMEMARCGEIDAISDAASLRLEKISQGTMSLRASLESGTSRRSFLSSRSYVSALAPSVKSKINVEEYETAGRPESAEASIAEEGALLYEKRHFQRNGSTSEEISSLQIVPKRSRPLRRRLTLPWRRKLNSIEEEDDD